MIGGPYPFTDATIFKASWLESASFLLLTRFGRLGYLYFDQQLW